MLTCWCVSVLVGVFRGCDSGIGSVLNVPDEGQKKVVVSVIEVEQLRTLTKKALVSITSSKCFGEVLKICIFAAHVPLR